MLALELDPQGFFHLRVGGPGPHEPAADVGAKILALPDATGPIRVLANVEQAAETVPWKLEWILHVARERHRLRIALRRGDPHPLDRIDGWANVVGIELQEFANDADAIAWLLRE